jgi:uncharacterized damage-inducible protein DinB
MTRGVLGRIVEHNNWANAALLSACARLTAEQLDARPRSPREWTIRQVLAHLVGSQVGYVSMLSPGSRRSADPGSSWEDLARAAQESGRSLQAIADGEVAVAWEADLETRDGYVVKPWTVFVQAVNHGNDHRRQACSLLRALGVPPPQLDGWGFGEASGAVVQAPQGG